MKYAGWKWLVSLILLIGFFLPAKTLAADVPKPVGKSIFVQDFANVLSEEQKEQLVQHSIALEEATTAQLAVLTLPTIGDEPIEEFAVKALREYQLGSSENDNGALIVITTQPNSNDDRHFFLTTGYGLEGALPDGKVGRIIDQKAMPLLKDERPDLALINAYQEFFNEIAIEYDWDGRMDEKIESDEKFPISIFGLIVVFFILYQFINRDGGGPGGGRRARRSGSPVFFPGSFGGGGSSGGGFHGGGGGSGGGGGAGRSW